ncbi:MAG: hypothetical protein AB1650_06520 [Candidatus Omnitrophota bacterium]
MKNPKSTIYRVVSACLIVILAVTLSVPAQAQSALTPSVIEGLNLPAPGTMISLSSAYNPPIIKGITIYPDNPLKFDFIVSPGDDNLKGDALKKEADKLIKYFMASLTVPADEMWVNLSPYEKDRIIADGLSQTELGRDLLAQDYILKQVTASLMYPEEKLGDDFWKMVYAKAQVQFGTTEIPVNTFNKVWIVPEKANVYVHGNNIFVVDSYLKVMLEEDYLALETNLKHANHGVGIIPKDQIEETSDVSRQVIREILIPEIEKEVNQGKNFASLRQIFNSMILATWYKKNLKESLLGQVYVNQNKVEGVDLKDKQVKEKIYNQYVKALEKGVFDFIREDDDPIAQERIPRRYFSGGIQGADNVGERIMSYAEIEKVFVGDEALITVELRNPKNPSERLVDTGATMKKLWTKIKKISVSDNDRWFLRDGNLSHWEQIIDGQVEFDKEKMVITFSVGNNKGETQRISVKVKKVVSKNEIVKGAHLEAGALRFLGVADWYDTKFQGETVLLEENPYNINYISTDSIIGVSEFLFQNEPSSIAYPIIETAIKSDRKFFAQAANRSGDEVRGWISKALGYFPFQSLDWESVPKQFLAKALARNELTRYENILRLEDVLFAGQIDVNEKTNSNAKALFSLNPVRRLRAYMALKQTNDLEEAKLLKEMYPRASIAMKKLVRFLFYWVTREEAMVTGEYYGITRKGNSRLKDTKERLDQLLPTLLERFPNEVLRIRDEGVSTGTLSENLFRHVASKTKEFKYIATDLVTKLIYITNSEKGYTAVFTDEQDGHTDNFIQIKQGNRIYTPQGVNRVVRVLGEDAASFTAEVRSAFEMYKQEGGLSDKYVTEEVGLFDFEVEKLAKTDERFELSQHNIFQKVPTQEQGHLTILSNVLVPTYYSQSELVEGIKSAGLNTVEGGLVLVINESYLGTGLGPVSDGIYVHPFSVFERRGNQLVRLFFSSIGPQKGFNRAMKAEDIESVNLGDREVISSDVGGIDLNSNNLELNVQGDEVKMSPYPGILNEISVNGFVPVIIDVAPISNVPILLGIQSVETTGVR